MDNPQRAAAVERWGDLVWRLALAGAKNQHDAEDIFQEVFERFFRHEARLLTEEHQKAWLIRCTINRCKSLFSSPWRKRKVSLDDIRELGIPDDTREVYLAVRQLPAKYALVVHLHYYEGYTVAEIAGQLGCAEGTVKSQLSRARAMIDEEGCLGAGYTILGTEATAALGPEAQEVVFTADRPFLFAITGVDGQILFLGVVNQP